MAVHRLREEQISERLKLVPIVPDEPVMPLKPPPPMRDLQAEREERIARHSQVTVSALGSILAIARLLSVRAILLLSVVGAFALALFTASRPTLPALVTLGLYSVIVVSLVVLESGVLTRRE